jgi:Flp pilus assembly protein CpaB
LLLAVLAGAGVFLLGNLTGGGAIGGGPTTTVVTAKQAIGVRHTITADDLSTDKVSGTFTSANNVYTNKNDVVNLIAEIQISKGSVITSDMLAKDVGLVPAGSAPAYLPLASGYVAMTIPTGELQGVAGHITLGDFFTVIASGNITVVAPNVNLQQAGGSRVVSKTVFTNVRVIGLGPASANVQPAGGATTVGGTAPTSGVVSSLTIELTQCDAEYFTWFINNMTLKYTIESFHDYLTAPTTPDPTCPTVLSAQGVTNKQVDARYHFSAL